MLAEASYDFVSDPYGSTVNKGFLMDQPNYWYSALSDIERFINTLAIATVAGLDVPLSGRFKMWVIRRRSGRH